MKHWLVVKADTAGTLAEVASTVVLWEAVPTGVVSAAEVSVTL